MKLKSLVIYFGICTLFLRTTTSHSPSRRVVQGMIVQKWQFPYVVQVDVFSGQRHPFTQGGSVIGKRFVMTALTKSQDIEWIDCYFGINYLGDLYEMMRVYPTDIHINEGDIHPFEHEYHNAHTFNNTVGDLRSATLAIIHLPEALNLNKIKALSLVSNSEAFFNKVAKVVGFGQYSTPMTRRQMARRYLSVQDCADCEGILRKTFMKVVKDDECNFVGTDPGKFICAEPAQAGMVPCNGDEGSALIFKDYNTKKYIALGVFARVTEQCGGTSVFFNLQKHYKWIRNITQRWYE